VVTGGEVMAAEEEEDVWFLVERKEEDVWLC
jgi:hypothetical protein